MALAHARHPHYQAATRWIDALGPENFLYFCRVTQLGLLRLLTTQSAMGVDVLTQAESWKVYDLFLEDERVRFVDEPHTVSTDFRRRTNRREVSAKQWADGYLAAFAGSSGFQLVTFDKSLAKQMAGSLLLKG